MQLVELSSKGKRKVVRLQVESQQSRNERPTTTTVVVMMFVLFPVRTIILIDLQANKLRCHRVERKTFLAACPHVSTCPLQQQQEKSTTLARASKRKWHANEQSHSYLFVVVVTAVVACLNADQCEGIPILLARERARARSGKESPIEVELSAPDGFFPAFVLREREAAGSTFA